MTVEDAGMTVEDAGVTVVVDVFLQALNDFDFIC
jgi:hypothetical protein